MAAKLEGSTPKPKKRKKDKRPKKEKAKKKKKRSSSSSSTEEDLKERKKKSKKKKRRQSTSSSSSSTSGSEEEWVVKGENPEKSESSDQNPFPKRDDWMSGMFLPTYSKEKDSRDKSRKKTEYVEYDPSANARELNPHWKNGGEGLPAFKKPASDDDEPGPSQAAWSKSGSSGNWKKKTEIEGIADFHNEIKSSSSEESEPEEEIPKKIEASSRTSDFLTDQQMNELGAKIIKAEIMGNEDLLADLKEKLERARQVRNNFKSELKDKKASENGDKTTAMETEDVLLTTTNAKGLARPLQARSTEADLWGGRKGKKTSKKEKILTHEGGERARFFADDDKYTLKQMFEAEKMGTSSESDQQFVNIASKYKNKNDDLEDIFSDEVRKTTDEGVSDERERSRAIREHESMARMLENCDRCFDSKKMEKQLIVSMGDEVCLSLPSYEGLETGHCLLSPMQHVSCSTLADENVWAEVESFKNALTQMFRKQGKDCIFFETAINLHRKPHLTIHCVPSRGFEMAAFYFKKAIQESEAEWAQNRQLVDLKKEKKTLRKAIPKGLPYFWVDFGDGVSFAHVIEDQERFPSNFAQEIIGGILNLDPYTWRKPRKENNPIQKVKQFADWWKPFDCTK